MTTYGPYERFTIRTPDAIITVTGNNVVATVTGCDGGALPKDYSITDVDSENGARKTARQDDCLESESSHSSSTVDDQPSTTAGRDMELVSVREEQISSDVVPILTANNGITVDSSSKPNDIGSEADESRGSPHHSASEHGCTTPGNPIPIGSDCNSDSDNNSQLCETSAEPQSVGSKRKCSEGGEYDDQSLVTKKCSVSQVDGDANTDSKSSRHTRLHPEGKPYSCDTCGKTFTTSWYLSQHVRIHTGEKPYSCDTCGKTFATSQYLSQHTRIHTGKKRHTCDTCGKAFMTSHQLTQHIRTHTGERPYSCDICGKTFTQSSSVTTHLRTHTGEKPYSCDVCGKTFAVSHSLVNHTRIHTGEKPYSCDTCGKAFITLHQLTQHTRTHTGERPYSCDICGKTFTQSSSVAAHLRTHTGVKR